MSFDNKCRYTHTFGYITFRPIHFQPIAIALVENVWDEMS